MKTLVLIALLCAAVGCGAAGAEVDGVQSAVNGGAAGMYGQAFQVSQPSTQTTDCAAFPKGDDWRNMTLDPAYSNVGGAGASVSFTCQRCGWQVTGQQCRELVGMLPTIDDPKYRLCTSISAEFASCLQSERCVCGGELPERCAELKLRVDECLGQPDFMPPTAPAVDAPNQGAAGCRSSALPEGKTVDWSASFAKQPIGGAGAILASTCVRCGWDTSGDSCQSIVYTLPGIYEPHYQACWEPSIAFATCYERENCHCSGTIPAACAEHKTAVDECIAQARHEVD